MTDFILLTHRFKLLGMVYHVEDLGLLSLWLKDITQFEKGDAYVPTLLSKLNFSNPGKFCADPDNRLHYCLDLLVAENTTKADFRAALRVAARVIDIRQEAILKVRYAGCTWEQANRPKRQVKDPSRPNPKVAKQIEEAVKHVIGERSSPEG